MNKVEMIKNIAFEANVTNKVAEAVIDAYGKFVLGVLSVNKDEKITLPGLGSFSVKHVPERSGIVQLGENKGSKWHKDAHDELKFTISNSAKNI